jgi:predicted O-methyltransferase YrrM
MTCKQLLERIREVYKDQKGSIDSEGEWLAELASRVPRKGVIVEIGSYKGQSGAYLAAGAKEGVTTFLIDLWDRTKQNLVSPENRYALSSAQFMEIAIKNLKELGLYKNIVLLKGLSVDFASTWGDMGIDLLFIDGDHSYEGIKSDYEAWYPHVKDGGVVAFHDYMERWTGVMKYIDETVSKQLKFIKIQDRIWAGEK